MLPNQPVDNIVNSPSANPKLARQCALIPLLFIEPRFYFSDLILGELASVISFANKSWGRRISLFFKHVFHVVLMGSQKKMIRANTLSVIAAVANKKSVRNFSVMNFPRNSMGSFHALAADPKMHFSVAAFIGVSVPLPAFKTKVNLSPKSLFNGFGFSSHDPCLTQEVCHRS
jgi:hypothetical protein